MRYYLDTNILVFILTRRPDDISSEVDSIIGDYANTLCTSTVCVMELIQLCQIGKLNPPKGVKIPNVTDLLDWLDNNCITIVPVNRLHLQTLSELPYYDDHRDPNDRLIVAQAISDQAHLISSDTKMERYRKNGLQFVFNKR